MFVSDLFNNVMHLVFKLCGKLVERHINTLFYFVLVERNKIAKRTKKYLEYNLPFPA